ncbi:hypothetical protein C7S18_06990 [Ahniella affigens]|uniref:Protein kinase domain-containing protein n=1 Tax=Ahniella affigens TaxID=2021234 RepID=A0A2P1PQ34_9GAMM|nr:serine/threonine-protein kinase [Ahniella affigens]AVP96957.1 hypothetical protein C7S18_06990 [Ahniella affigens]
MPIDDQDGLLLKVAEDITDGRPVDWDTLSQQLDAEALKQLRALADLAKQFTAAQQSLESTTATTADMLPEPPLPPKSVAEPNLEHCSQFAHLKILGEIGRGSSGIVYRAFDPLLQRTVALKLCNPDGGQIDDLLHEAQQMAKVNHPGVLKIHGAQIVDAQVGFWSDLVEGESISTRLDRTTTVPAPEAVLIGLELCAALAAIHQLGLVHGDVKAQNVVRDRHGRHILVDFGSARNIHERATVSGTPLYLAPELVGGGQNTPPDDLYSLGVLLFKMISGHFPVDARTLVELESAHRDQRRRYLLDLVPDLNVELAGVIERAVHPKRAQRYQSAGALAAELRRTLPAVQPLQVTHRLDGPTENVPASRPNRRFWWVGLGLLAGILATILLVQHWHDLNGPIQTDLRWTKSTGGVEFQLVDGDQITIGDTLSLQLALAESAHVYVFNEDATGSVYQLFPLPGAALANPLPAKRPIRLPGEVSGQARDWQVTSTGSRERFYVLVSPHAIAALDPATSGIATADIGRPIDRSSLYASALLTRGVGGLSERQSIDSQFPIGTWLRELGQNDPRVRVQHFELLNP